MEIINFLVRGRSALAVNILFDRERVQLRHTPSRESYEEKTTFEVIGVQFSWCCRAIIFTKFMSVSNSKPFHLKSYEFKSRGV